MLVISDSLQKQDPWANYNPQHIASARSPRVSMPPVATHMWQPIATAELQVDGLSPIDLKAWSRKLDGLAGEVRELGKALRGAMVSLPGPALGAAESVTPPFLVRSPPSPSL